VYAAVLALLLGIRAADVVQRHVPARRAVASPLPETQAVGYARERQAL